jgi:hypothetical protein
MYLEKDKATNLERMKYFLFRGPTIMDQII